jgi:hypothetical protein
MSIQFLYGDGKGTIVDEYGRPEPMDYIVDEEQYVLQIVSSFTQHLSNLPHGDEEAEIMQLDDTKNDADVVIKESTAKRNYTIYTDQDKMRFLKLLLEKCMSASSAG